jgi:hypothetical protein
VISTTIYAERRLLLTRHAINPAAAVDGGHCHACGTEV